MDAIMKGPVTPEEFLDAEVNAIMSLGAEYSAEPVTVYAAVSTLLKEMRREREMLYQLLERRGCE